MAYSTINKSTDYFNTKLYTGNGSTNAITGVGFEPSFTWIKNRSNTSSHNVFDAVRGATKAIFTNATDAEYTDASRLSAFNSDGFTINGDTSNQTNANGSNFVSWNWKANGAGSSNTDGSITSTVSVNTTAGFSIVKYTGTNSNSTIGHGLGAVPKMIIVKNTGSSYEWCVYHDALAANENLYLNTTAAAAQSDVGDVWNSTAPTSTTFGVGGNKIYTNYQSENYIAYCFAEKKGYSKFGSVNGNGNADGPFVYTGFAPSFVLYKKYNGLGDWYFVDNKRPGYNDNDKRLYANTNQAEETYDLINFYSNGFKLTNSTHTYTNDSAGTYLYMAFGQSLVGSNNVPCTAR
jgi:hypothetical protein